MQTNQINLVSNVDGTSSDNGNKSFYAPWLKEFFIIMTAIYGRLWTDQFVGKDVEEAIKRIWQNVLSQFEPGLIRKAVHEIAITHRFPPKPAELLEVLYLLKKRSQDQELFRTQEMQRLIAPAQKKQSKASLEKLLIMWEKLGDQKKIKEIKLLLNDLKESS